MSRAPDTLTRAADWTAAAACAETDPDLFFPDPRDAAAVETARAICARCPVRRPCLEAELATERGAGRTYRHGIRGGLDGTERWHLTRQRRTRDAA